MRIWLRFVVMLCAGCASLGSARHQATVSVVSAHAVLSAVQDDEMALVCGRPTAPPAPACVSAETNRVIATKLVTAFDYDGRVAALAALLLWLCLPESRPKEYLD